MKIFKSAIIKKQLTKEELQALESDFRRYKQLNHIPCAFGRGVLYDHPNTLPSVREEEIRHIHTIDPQDWHIVRAYRELNRNNLYTSILRQFDA